MLLPGTQRQTPTQAVHTVAKQQATQARNGKQTGGGGGRGVGCGRAGGGEGEREGLCIKNTLNFKLQRCVCGYQTSLFVSRSQAGHSLEVG